MIAFDYSSFMILAASAVGILALPVIILSLYTRKPSKIKLQGRHVLVSRLLLLLFDFSPQVSIGYK